MTNRPPGIFFTYTLVGFMFLSLWLTEAAERAPPHLLNETASEVGDMMKDPYHNITTSASDRDEDPLVDNETDVVDDPHVIHENKTHEEEHKPNMPIDVGTDPTTVSSVELETVIFTTSPPEVSEEGNRDSSATSTAESSTAELVSSRASSGSNTNNLESSVAGNSSVLQSTDGSELRSTVGITPASVDTISTGDSQQSDEGATSLPVAALVSQHDTHDHPTVGKATSLNHTTQAAAILAGVLVLVALAGYVGLLSWRRLLEKRYGNREMLVNEEDDFRHFEL